MILYTSIRKPCKHCPYLGKKKIFNLLRKNNYNDLVSHYRKHSLSAFFLPFNHILAFLSQRILLKSHSTTITNRGTTLKLLHLLYIYRKKKTWHFISVHFFNNIYKITLSDLIISYIFNTI